MTAPPSISGSISPRPIPIRRRCASRPLASAAGVKVRFRPFLLGPIFKAQGWDTSPFNLYPGQGPQHVARPGTALPPSFVAAVPPARAVSAEQPAAARVALVGLADKAGARTFAVAVFRAQFADGRRIDDTDTLAAILSELERRCRRPRSQPRNPTTTRCGCGPQTEEAQRLGLFGAPSFTTADGELFWGNDRLEQALAWAKRATARDRAASAGRPAPCSSLASRTVYSPKWKIEAASTAVAWPSRMPSTR